MELLLDKGFLAFISVGCDRADSDFGGELEELEVEAVDRLEGADRMALQNMPDGDGQLPRHRHRGLVAAAAGGDGQAPLLERVVDLEEFLGRLDEEGAKRDFAMALQARLSFASR